jgi:6-pyruvoyltetrahydropterin/6-carboxytetrahydropterin synthase
MPRSIWRLTVRDEFCAAHALRQYQGKCERLHGHNYAVAVTVEGRTLQPDTGLLLDFTDLKRMLKGVLEQVDHQFLNEVPPFDQINPSAENVSRSIWQNLLLRLPDTVRLHSVTVEEKNGQSATYMETD